MANHDNNRDDRVFSEPLRTLDIEEVDQVSGGGPFEGDNFHKPAGSADNQGYQS